MISNLPQDWTTGSNHVYSWILLLLALTGTVLGNTIFLGIHLAVPKLRQLYLFKLSLPVVLEDLTYATICLVQCGINVDAMEFVGHQDMCLFQAIYAIFFTCLNTSAMSVFLLAAYLLLFQNRHLTVREIAMIHFFLVAYSGTITTIMIGVHIHPGMTYQLLPVGTFCVPAIFLPFQGSILYMCIILPCVVVNVSLYVKIHRGIRQMAQCLHDQGMMDMTVRPSQMRIIRQMFVYVVMVVVCYLPFLSANLSEWITNQRANPVFFGIGGFSGHVSGVVNPILYFWLNRVGRTILMETCYPEGLISLSFGSMNQLDARASSNALNTQDSSRTHQRTESQIHSARQVNHGTLIQLLHSPVGRQKYLEFCIKEHNQENVLFWTHVQEFREFVQKTLSTHPYFLSLEHHTLLIRMMEKINSTFIGKLAPLQINIASEDREHQILNYLCVMDGLVPNSDLTVHQVEQLTSLFDPTCSLVQDLMFADSFQRYAHSQKLHRAVELTPIVSSMQDGSMLA